MKNVQTFLLVLFSLSAMAQPSDSYIMNMLDTSKTPGISVAVLKNGQWLYERHVGLADVANNKGVTRGTVWGASTISFVVVTTAVMQLKERGLLSLDNNINHYLPFTFQHPIHTADTVTLRMLLTEAGSISDYVPLFTASGDSPISLDSFIRNYFEPGGSYYNATSNFTSYTPGTTWQYSEVSYALGAYIVERITGDDFSHYCDTAIFDKLCMKNTSYKRSGISDTSNIARPYHLQEGTYIDQGLWGIPDYPALQLRTNITALARFTDMLLDYGIYNGTRILDSNSVAEMMHGYISTPSTEQGLGFFETAMKNSDIIWMQSGLKTGTGSFMGISHPRKIAIVMLYNGCSGYYGLNSLLDTLYSYALATTPLATDTFPDCNEVAESPDVINYPYPLSVFPNPTSGVTTISVAERGLAILTDIQGERKGTYKLLEVTTL